VVNDYDALRDYLKKQHLAEFVLTFEEIEALYKKLHKVQHRRLETMTSGENDSGDNRDQFVDEEIGGPFVESPGKREFAEGNDASNPDDATREPFPKT